MDSGPFWGFGAFSGIRGLFGDSGPFRGFKDSGPFLGFRGLFTDSRPFSRIHGFAAFFADSRIRGLFRGFAAWIHGREERRGANEPPCETFAT